MAAANQACAACKFQRRKCLPDCPLAPYFPPDQPKRFQNVHKVFGVSSVLRILKLVDSNKREETAKSMVFEADTREKDPVHGTYGLIATLENQVAKLKEELQQAREQLHTAKQQHMSMYTQAQKMQGLQYGRNSLVHTSAAGHSSLLPQYGVSNQATMNRPILQQTFQAEPVTYRTNGFESPVTQQGAYRTGFETEQTSYDSRFTLNSSLTAAREMNHMQQTPTEQQNQFSKMESRTFASSSSIDDAQSLNSDGGSSLQVNNVNRDDFLQMQLQTSSAPTIQFPTKLQTTGPAAHFATMAAAAAAAQQQQQQSQAHFTALTASQQQQSNQQAQQQQQGSNQQSSCRSHFSHLDQLSNSHYAQYIALRALQERSIRPLTAQQLLG